MLKKIFLLFFSLYSISIGYSGENNHIANGYWLQRDKDTNTNVSVIHAYNNKQGNLNARVFVPLSNSDYGRVYAPIIYCKECGKGNAYGNKYDYSNGKYKYQGLEFVWNVKKLNSYGNDAIYDDGAVLNPHDGKYYHVKAHVMENGDKIYVRAYWGPLGKDEYWDRISKEQAYKIKKLCGLTKDNVYAYEDEEGKVADQKLFSQCSTRNFIKDPL